MLAFLAIACKDTERIEREDALKANLSEMRKAIANYKADRGQYPAKLEDLVPNYIRVIPKDPMTMAADWRVTTEETVTPSTDFQTTTEAPAPAVIIDVHSSAPGTDRNGVPFANY